MVSCHKNHICKIIFLCSYYFIHSIKILSFLRSELNDFNKLIDEKHECSKIFFDKLSPLFPVQILNSNGIFENMKRFSRLSLDIPLPEVFGHCSLEPMQLFIQNIFKKTSQTEKSVFMDSHTNIGRILKGVDMEKVFLFFIITDARTNLQFLQNLKITLKIITLELYRYIYLLLRMIIFFCFSHGIFNF